MPPLALGGLNRREEGMATASQGYLPPLCPLQGMPSEDQHHHCLNRGFQRLGKKSKLPTLLMCW
jgi:hypothetical protein